MYKDILMSTDKTKLFFIDSRDCAFFYLSPDIPIYLSLSIYSLILDFYDIQIHTTVYNI